MDSIRHASVNISKRPTIQQIRPAHHIKRIQSRWTREILAKLNELRPSVGGVQGLKIWGELETIGLDEPIGHDLDVTCQWLEAVYLVGNARQGSEGLQVAVLSVREPEVTCGVVLPNVVEGRKVPVVEVVHYLLQAVNSLSSM